MSKGTQRRACCAGLSVSPDGSLLVSMSDDKSIKVFDIPNIDMMAMLRLTFVPSCTEWIFRVRCYRPSALCKVQKSPDGFSQMDARTLSTFLLSILLYSQNLTCTETLMLSLPV